MLNATQHQPQLMVGSVIRSPQFAYVTYQLVRDACGIYTADSLYRMPQIGFAANPMEYRDNSGVKHEVIAAAYRPELSDHHFVVQAINSNKFILMDMLTSKEYFMYPAPHIKLIYLSSRR